MGTTRFDDTGGSDQLYFRPDILRGRDGTKPMGGDSTQAKAKTEKKPQSKHLSNALFNYRLE